MYSDSDEQVTPAQKAAVETLLKRGFFWDKTITGQIEMTVAVLLSKRVKFSTYYAEVESDGSVNGGTLARFLSTLPGKR